jgi:hypothetical protein
VERPGTQRGGPRGHIQPGDRHPGDH